MMEDFFDPDNYEWVRGEKFTFQQKDDVTFEDYEDVVLTIEDNSCTIEMVTLEGGYNVKIVISDIGEVDLTLPTVK